MALDANEVWIWTDVNGVMTTDPLSQSSLQDYVDCARRFQLRYLERLSYPAIGSEPALENERHQQEGEFFHRLVQQYLIGIPSQQISKLANTANLERWWENFINAKELKELGSQSGSVLLRKIDNENEVVVRNVIQKDGPGTVINGI